MLFEIRGRRKRFIQVIFGLLAAVFTISFVGFGIGSDAGGGLFDAVGVGGGPGGGNSPRNPQFEAQIEDAELRLQADPQNEEALLLIARVRYLAGQDQLQQDEQGNILVSDEARSQLEGSVQAWDDYIALDPAEPDTNVGRLVVLSFVHLNDAAGAAEVQKVLVAAEPTSRGYSELARYLYFDGQMNQGDKAAAEAVASAEKADRAGIRSQLKGIADQARKQQRVQAALEEAGSTGTAPNPLADPTAPAGGSDGG